MLWRLQKAGGVGGADQPWTSGTNAAFFFFLQGSLSSLVHVGVVDGSVAQGGALLCGFGFFLPANSREAASGEEAPSRIS
jgi:hypothetical protein